MKDSKIPGPYRAISLGDIGIDGLLTLLDRGNTWSRRGDFNSFQEALFAARDRQKTTMEKTRRDQREETGYWARQIRRQFHKIPFLRVGIDLNAQPDKQVPTGDVP